MSVIVKGMEMPMMCADCKLKYYGQGDNYACAYCSITDKEIDYIARHPDCPLEDADDGWISIKDRLPEENGEYLVTRESGFYRYMDIVRKSNCNSDLPMASDIKAWKPLPKPYKPKEDKHND